MRPVAGRACIAQAQPVTARLRAGKERVFLVPCLFYFTAPTHHSRLQRQGEGVVLEYYDLRVWKPDASV
jgi:hypothetical protein